MPRRIRPRCSIPYRGGESPAASRTTASRALNVILILGLSLLLLWLAGHVLLLAFASLLFAVFLDAVMDMVSRLTRLRRRPWGLALSVVLLLSVAGLAVWVLGPQIAEQTEQLVTDLPDAYRRWIQWLEETQWGRWVLFHARAVGDREAGRAMQWVGSAASSLFNVLIGAALVLVVGLYVAAEARRYIDGTLRLLPVNRRARGLEVQRALARVVRGWLLAQMVSMLVLGVAAYIGLTLLGIPLALALALLTALLTFIPNLGPFLSVIPPALLGLQQSPWVMAAVLLFYLVLQNVEGYFITPMVQRSAISMPPALLLIMQLLLAILFGFLGLLLAAPLTAALMVLVKMLYIEDTLGDRAEPHVSPARDG